MKNRTMKFLGRRMMTSRWKLLSSFQVTSNFWGCIFRCTVFSVFSVIWLNLSVRQRQLLFEKCLKINKRQISSDTLEGGGRENRKKNHRSDDTLRLLSEPGWKIQGAWVRDHFKWHSGWATSESRVTLTLWSFWRRFKMRNTATDRIPLCMLFSLL